MIQREQPNQLQNQQRGEVLIHNRERILEVTSRIKNIFQQYTSPQIRAIINTAENIERLAQNNSYAQLQLELVRLGTQLRELSRLMRDKKVGEYLEKYAEGELDQQGILAANVINSINMAILGEYVYQLYMAEKLGLRIEDLNAIIRGEVPRDIMKQKEEIIKGMNELRHEWELAIRENEEIIEEIFQSNTSASLLVLFRTNQLLAAFTSHFGKDEIINEYKLNEFIKNIESIEELKEYAYVFESEKENLIGNKVDEKLINYLRKKIGREVIIRELSPSITTRYFFIASTLEENEAERYFSRLIEDPTRVIYDAYLVEPLILEGKKGEEIQLSPMWRYVDLINALATTEIDFALSSFTAFPPNNFQYHLSTLSQNNIFIRDLAFGAFYISHSQVQTFFPPFPYLLEVGLGRVFITRFERAFQNIRAPAVRKYPIPLELGGVYSTSNLGNSYLGYFGTPQGGFGIYRDTVGGRDVWIGAGNYLDPNESIAKIREISGVIEKFGDNRYASLILGILGQKAILEERNDWLLVALNPALSGMFGGEMQRWDGNELRYFYYLGKTIQGVFARREQETPEGKQKNILLGGSYDETFALFNIISQDKDRMEISSEELEALSNIKEIRLIAGRDNKLARIEVITKDGKIERLGAIAEGEDIGGGFDAIGIVIEGGRVGFTVYERGRRVKIGGEEVIVSGIAKDILTENPEIGLRIDTLFGLNTSAVYREGDIALNAGWRNNNFRVNIGVENLLKDSSLIASVGWYEGMAGVGIAFRQPTQKQQGEIALEGRIGNWRSRASLLITGQGFPIIEGNWRIRGRAITNEFVFNNILIGVGSYYIRREGGKEKGDKAYLRAYGLSAVYGFTRSSNIRGETTIKRQIGVGGNIWGLNIQGGLIYNQTKSSDDTSINNTRYAASLSFPLGWFWRGAKNATLVLSASGYVEGENYIHSGGGTLRLRW